MSTVLTGEKKSGGNLTYEEYIKLPEGAPYQLIGGELVMEPAPETYHQTISIKLTLQLANYVEKNDLGTVLYAPVDVHLNQRNVYQPDLLFISKERSHIIETKNINGVPDLVIEILSASNAYYDLRKKYKVYEQCGVKEYWIVDPEEKSVQVYMLESGRYILQQEVTEQGQVTSSIIPGLIVEIEEIFRR